MILINNILVVSMDKNCCEEIMDLKKKILEIQDKMGIVEPEHEFDCGSVILFIFLASVILMAMNGILELTFCRH